MLAPVPQPNPTPSPTVFMDVDHRGLIVSRKYRRGALIQLRAVCRQALTDEIVLLHCGLPMGGQCCDTVDWPTSVDWLQRGLILDGDLGLTLWCSETAALIDGSDGQAA